MGGQNVIIALGAVVLAGLLFIVGSAFVGNYDYQLMGADQLFSWGTMYLVSGLLIVVVIFLVIFVNKRR
ncbi:MAG TPA: hypothetical protein ENN44_06220 [Methanoculleus sp.]|nr:hypothetical protein [Methanoculleus sp.]